ncbi:MAG: ACP S-malonyltransferase [Proteobacteria bacterium]|nr:ACP S-malonyltransferase [Pseudomonadota bacterium]
MSTALLFPGQGSQYIGMGTKWIQKYPYTRDFFTRADSALDFSLSKICFEGPDTELVKTEYTQPAILTTSIAMFEVLKREKNINFSYVAGHSLGEYSALVAAGALNFEEAVRIVNLRGKLMQKAVPVGKGKMAAVVRCDENVLIGEIKKIDPAGTVLSAANYNSDEQIVVSGGAEAIDALCANLKELKIKAIPLNVSAPFHSPLMKTIIPEFTNALNKLKISKLNVPYVANIDANIHSDSSVIVNNLARQIPGSVMWKQTITKLASSGVNRAVEVGPGKVLGGLCGKIAGSFECISMDTLETLDSI